jgi:FxsC-like protein
VRDEALARLGRYQYHERAMGAEYPDQGLMSLMRTDPAAYRVVLRVIARRVRYAAELFRLPVARDLDLATVRSPFPAQHTVETVWPSTGHVRLFVAAGVADAPPADRRRTEYYGHSPLDWTPYRPPVHPTLAHRAQRVILDEEFTSSLEVVGQDLGSKLDEARRNNQPSVLLVDAWAAREAPYRDPLSAYDRENHPHTGVLVPCHDSDDESGAEALWQELSEVFPRNWMRRHDLYDRLFQVRVAKRTFDDRLAVMVAQAQSRLMKAAPPRRLPGGPPAPPMPGLMVPPPVEHTGRDETPDPTSRKDPDDDR